MPTQVVLKNRIPSIMAELPVRIGNATLATAEVIAAGAAQRAPQATGELVDSIEARSYNTGVGRGIQEQAAVYAIFYWIFQEFGTTNQPARPFMIPAVEAAWAGVGKIVHEYLVGL